MGHLSVEDVQIVRVLMLDDAVAGPAVSQLWLAAVPREQAVEAVKTRIPPKWTAELTDQRLAPAHIARLNLRPGDVSELSSA